ncbi:MAG: hypothetical protein JW797_01460 [Bradymonadales bacterium]|nr:hypothetical protein [Bradymonadales bacterium]
MDINWMQVLAYLGLGLLGLGLSGSAIGLSISGSAVTGCRPERRNSALVVSLLPGTQGLYAFAVGFLCFGAIQKAGEASIQAVSAVGQEAAELALLASNQYFMVFACGLVTGIACLFSGWYQGVVCAAGIKSINQDRLPMGQAMLLAVIVEFYAILSLAFSVLMLFG